MPEKLNIRDAIVRLAGGEDERNPLLFFDAPPEGFDECIVGVATRCGMEPVVAYDRGMVLKKLAREFAEDLKEEENYLDDPRTVAVEWFDFNTIGSWIGDKTPVFIDFVDREEIEEEVPDAEVQEATSGD